MIEQLYLHSILILLVFSVSIFYPKYIGNKSGFILIVPILIYVTLEQLPDQVFNTSHILIGILYATLSFFPATWLVGSANATSFTFSRAIQNLKTDKVDYILLFLYSAANVIYEELVWRVFLVEILSLYLSPVIVILLASFLFFFSHQNTRNISWQSVELLIFSLFITTIYLVSSSLLLVVTIHLMRNLYVIFNTIGDENFS